MSRRTSIVNIEEWLDKCPNDEPDSVIYDEDYVQDIAVMRSSQKAKDLEGLYKIVTEICTKIGLPPDTLEERLSDIDDCIVTFISTIQKDVQDEFDKLCRYKQDLLNKIQKMTSDLYLPPYVPEENLTLLQNCKKFKTEFSKLNNIREKRMLKWQELRDKQLQLCNILGIKTPEQVSMQTDIPTENELDKFASVILELEKEEKRRKEKYKILKDMILKCMDLLECDDEEISAQLEPRNYSEENLKKLSETHSKLEALYVKNCSKYAKLKERLMSLYERLDITGPERDLFLHEHSTCKPSLMIEMELKIEEYEELKKQNIGKFIEKIREELITEYDRCYIDTEQRDAFFALPNEPCEELLELYEKELDRLKKYYEHNHEILERFKKWRLMWKELIELEVKASDPGRFNNRGGQLLAEERKRKTLQRNLPKVEKDLINLNNKYLADNGKKFKVFATDLDEFIAGCWDELNHAKEVEKRERQKAKMTPSKGPAGRTGLGAIPVRSTPTKRTLGGSRLLGPLSLSEQEFEAMAVARPTSAKRSANKTGRQ